MPRTNALASRVKTTGDTMTGALDFTTMVDGTVAIKLGAANIKMLLNYFRIDLTATKYYYFTTADGLGFVMGGANVPGTTYCFINNNNVFFPVQAPTASAPAYVLGGMYFDTTLNKLRIGGAAAWETVTSA